MIQDFSNTFEGQQAVKVRTLQLGGNHLMRKTVGMVLTGAMLAGVVSSLVFCLLIQSGLEQLAVKNEAKLELMKVQQVLFAERKQLLAEEQIVRDAAQLGLYIPLKRQIRHI